MPKYRKNATNICFCGHTKQKHNKQHHCLVCKCTSYTMDLLHNNLTMGKG